jgi:tetratricopeptide (TPR) repeat protein
MKLCVLVILSVMVMFLSLHYSDAQVLTNNFKSNATTLSGLSQDFYKHANGLFDQGQYQDAIFYYDKALSINSTQINALYNKALALDRLGRVDEAILSYSQVLAITPNDTDTLNNEGLDLAIVGKYNESISYFNKILAINPIDTDALYNKALALDSLGRHGEAKSYYEEVLAINPNDTAVLNKLNLTFNNANNKEMAGIQKTDRTSLIVVSIVVLIVALAIVINLARRRTRKKSKTEVLKPQVSQIADQLEKEMRSTETNIQNKNLESEKIVDDEWGGI